MILLIDNYDSFVYNLVQYLGEMGEELLVFRNDAISVEEIESLGPSELLVSPGPCTPNEAGISVEAIRRLSGKMPILGVCLGHQAIGQAFGARVVRAKAPMHGKTSLVYHDGSGLFTGLPNPFVATRYHSLVVELDSITDPLTATAFSDDGEVMAIEHRFLPVFGVQFHPESIMTEVGKSLLKNFLDFSRRKRTPMATVGKGRIRDESMASPSEAGATR